MFELTSVENKSVNSNLLVPSYAEILYQLLLSAYGHESSEEPAIASAPLVYILRSGAIYEELRVIKDVFHAFDPWWRVYAIDSLRNTSLAASLNARDKL